MVKDPEFGKRIDSLHSDINYLGSKDFEKFVYGQTKYYTDMAKRVGMRQ
jgi:tripartite-type tricarboxylate transporter receptor subunit TctC